MIEGGAMIMPRGLLMALRATLLGALLVGFVSMAIA